MSVKFVDLKRSHLTKEKVSSMAKSLALEVNENVSRDGVMVYGTEVQVERLLMSLEIKG